MDSPQRWHMTQDKYRPLQASTDTYKRLNLRKAAANKTCNLYRAEIWHRNQLAKTRQTCRFISELRDPLIPRQPIVECIYIYTSHIGRHFVDKSWVVFTVSFHPQTTWTLKSLTFLQWTNIYFTCNNIIHRISTSRCHFHICLQSNNIQQS